MEDINKKYKKEIEDYFKGNAQKLHTVVDKVLKRLNFHDVDTESYYSLAHEIFYNSLNYYDETKSFNKFIYSCLYKKFCTEMTRSCRQKRQADKNGISIDTPIGDDENSTLGDILADKNTVEKEIFEEKEIGYSKEMRQYLERLSILQREVLHLISIGYTPDDIIEELHINKKQYDDCYNAIHSYRNISILM